MGSFGDRNDAQVSAESLWRSPVFILGGWTGPWVDSGRDHWLESARELSAAASAYGVRWLTLRPYGALGESAIEVDVEHVVHLESCGVVIDPTSDGRQRLVDAFRAIGEGPINEASVAGSLYEPADGEPDLVVICGESDRLPPSLVWELAYAELVFTETNWENFAAQDLVAAVAQFGRRRRRFGGLDA